MLAALGQSGIHVAGDLVLEKRVEYEVNNVESGGVGIQVVRGGQPGGPSSAAGVSAGVSGAEAGVLLENLIFDSSLFDSAAALRRLRDVIGSAIGLGTAGGMDLARGLEWFWLLCALEGAGVLARGRDRQDSVTDVRFVRQMAQWFPEVVGTLDEQQERKLCRNISDERGNWKVNGRVIGLVDLEANRSRLCAMKGEKIDRILRVAYRGLLLKLVALKKELRA